MLSPLVASGRPERARSDQLRTSEAVLIGLYSRTCVAPVVLRYLPALALMAVFALPNTSYTTLKRGAQSLNVGHGSSSGVLRAGMNRPAGEEVAPTPPWKIS